MRQYTSVPVNWGALRGAAASAGLGFSGAVEGTGVVQHRPAGCSFVWGPASVTERLVTPALPPFLCLLPLQPQHLSSRLGRWGCRAGVAGWRGGLTQQVWEATSHSDCWGQSLTCGLAIVKGHPTSYLGEGCVSLLI